MTIIKNKTELTLAVEGARGPPKPERDHLLSAAIIEIIALSKIR